MKNGIVFLHPMKTAMTSVASCIRRELRVRCPGIEEHHFDSHETPQELMWRMDIEEDWFEKRYCILFVRNPYDRLVSFYHHMRHPKLGGNARGLCLRKSFAEFAREPGLKQIMRPMSDYVTCNGKNVIDFTGRYETLNADVYKLIDELGFDAPEEIKGLWDSARRLHQTEHEPYEAYYDDVLKAVVYQAYKNDFTEFGYRG